MHTIDTILVNYSAEIIIAISALTIILLVWNIVLSIRFSALNGKYKRMMRGSSGKNFENMLIEYMNEIEAAVERVNIINDELVNLKRQTDKCVQKCNIIRYNAFSDTGSDLSFSIALLDNYNDGVIITGIYGRNETFTYAKPISKGTSKYPLSVEEEVVLKRSLKGTQI